MQKSLSVSVCAEFRFVAGFAACPGAETIWISFMFPFGVGLFGYCWEKVGVVFLGVPIARAMGRGA